MSYHKYDLPRKTVSPFEEIASIGCLSMIVTFLTVVVIILWCLT